MYVTNTGYTHYRSDGEQCHTQAPFLILASTDKAKDPSGHEALFACVRQVALQQCGHFMMGRARIGNQSLTISGAYGNDGLPCDYDDLTERARSFFTPVPQLLADLYWSDGDHNSAGAEFQSLRHWALATLITNKT